MYMCMRMCVCMRMCMCVTRACLGQGATGVARQREQEQRRQAAIVRMNPFNK